VTDPNNNAKAKILYFIISSLTSGCCNWERYVRLRADAKRRAA